MKRMISVLLVLCLALTVTGCSSEMTQSYEIPDTMQNVDDGVLAQNDLYTLEWDDQAKCVLLRDRRTKYVWSTTPYEYFSAGKVNYNLSSPVAIEYYNTLDGSIQILKGLDCIDMGLVEAQRIAGGVRIIWYFYDAEITVATEYVLHEDHLQVRVPAAYIQEGTAARLLNVSVAPYLCSAANTEDSNTYLFVPAGSGALLYTDTEPGGAVREFSGEVYGYDPVRRQLDNAAQEQPIHLPVFGVKAGSNALFAIIEEGEGAARIDAQAGNSRNGYSTVYATFNVRGYNNIEHGVTDTYLLSKTRAEDAVFSVGYYPLSGESADYSGMAARYRRYLQENGALLQSAASQQSYHLTVLGGAQTAAYTLGIPHTTLLPLTTFAQVQTMLEQTVKLTGETPQVMLSGFGESGLDVDKLAGGFDFSTVLGKAVTQQQLESYCRGQQIPLFTDFDLIRYSRSGNGFHTWLHSASAANSEPAVQYILKPNVRVEDESRTAIHLLKRTKWSAAMDRLLSFCRDRVSGISLSTLGSTAYSDYSDDAYMLKGGIAVQTVSMLTQVKQSGHAVCVSAANGYAAGVADCVSAVPLQNGGYDAFDETVPFYAMVLRGSVPLYSTAMNLSPNSRKQLLRAVEAGVSPSFTLAWAVGEEAAYLDGNFYYGVSYADTCSLIEETVARTAAYLERIHGATIESHRILQQGVTRTVFSNGVQVTVNHTDEAVTVDGRTILAMDFHAEGGSVS